MEVHTLEIDSSERDYATYPDPSDYVIDLKNRIYDIRKITLVSARIPNSQTLIHARNNTFSIDGNLIVMPNGTYTSGDDLATTVRDAINGDDGDFSFAVQYNPNLNALEFTNNGTGPLANVFEFGNGVNARIGVGLTDTLSNLSTIDYTTPHQIFGFPPTNITIEPSESYTGGSINLQGPNSLVLRLSSGSDIFNKDIYIREPFYTSHILLNGPFLNFSAADDPVKHDFFSGPQKFIESLRIQFFYMSNGRLIPYDFRNQDHVLKFEIQCNTGKFKSIAADTASDVGVLPPPISIPELEDPYRWKQYVLISIIVFFGLFVLTVTRKRT